MTDEPGDTSTTAGMGSLGTSLVPSALSRRLQPGPDLHEDALRAFVHARKTFIAGERVDMTVLAASLGVDRTSLFRWVGKRDALLSEVLWSLAAPTLDQVDRRAVGAGADRVVTVLTDFTGALIDTEYFRAFLRREPARALRLLTTKESHVQRRFVAVTEAALREESDAGRMTLTLPCHDLAYLLVRISESFTYTDLITGEAPSGERALAAFRLVLRPA
ncbi:QsdR family transcriptional regulator [Sanguibacter antarcticus]|uniref:TetR family transcriptional regulator n=1 Tax=Sanguibacter antarcticus TaxID=372484 RepID=A0A2A9E6Q7_9MICO|nr:QsdR family transcriptional regulator [Sanguibacter antarcticus]PFG34534.1 TetR family transcriptional regulator [Sanguibacter antarcticus]